MGRHLNRFTSLVICIVGFLLLNFPFSAAAHNGEIAMAFPLEGIAIDGDLSDWPEKMPRYPISLAEYGMPPVDEDDYQGTFRIGYHAQKNAVYIAVEVRDESVVIDTTTQEAWDTQDGCEIYLDGFHTEAGSLGVQYRIWGKNRGYWKNATLGERIRADYHQYEWCIDIGSLNGKQVQLSPGMTLSLDVVVCDKDADGSFSWMAWGKGIEKRMPSRRGDVILAEDDGGIGRIAGKVIWVGTEDLITHRLLKIQSVTSEKLWFQGKTDPQGRFNIEVPEGKYKVEIGFRAGGKEVVTEVQNGRVEEVLLEVEASRGRKVKASKGRAVSAGGGIRKGLWQNFSVEDGLPASSSVEDILQDVEGIADILQDREGDLWFATGGGVCRYDGQQFTTFSTRDGLIHNVVQSLLEDREGNLWFGTDGGVSRYDGSSFTNFTSEDGLISNWIWSILEDREGNLWFGTDGGVSRYDGRGFTSFTSEDGLAGNWVWSILEDREGILWFGVWQGGISRYDGERFTTLTTEDGLVNNGVISILEDREGKLWFGTQGGASRYDGEKFVNFTTEDGLINNLVWEIIQDQEGNLWFGTGRSDGRPGVSRYDGTGWFGIGGGVSRYDGTEFVNFTTEDGLANNVVWSVLQDREGSLWFGSEGGGLSRYDGDQVKIITTEEGLAHDFVNCILEDREGNLWFGTDGGISRYDGEQFTTLTAVNGLPDDQVVSMLEDRNGNLWLTTGRSTGVSRYDGEQFTTFTTENGLSSNQVVSMLEDRHGDLWFGTLRGGVTRYDGNGFTPITSEDGLAHNWVWSMLEDRNGNLWFATGRSGAGGGLSRYDGKQFTNFSTKDGLTSNQVRSILEDRQGDLWFGTEGGGVSRYDGTQFVTFTTEDGLVHNWVSSMLEDRSGNLWFGTEGGGLSRYDGTVFQCLRKWDGLVNNIIEDMHQDRNGDVWIATRGGISRYRPHSGRPSIRLKNIVANRDYGVVEEVRLPTSWAYLAFEFQGRSFKTRSNQMTYLYRLEGYDADWLQTQKRQVIYHDLPVGEYVFQVQAVDRDLNYSEEPAQVRVVVHPPYVQLLLLGGLGIALIGLTVVSGYALRRRRDLRRAERELMAEMEEELQTAHDMQMGLMPTEPPQLEKFDIAGRCLPAKQVGGDFFQYFLQEDKLAIGMADVTGHAMEAAIPVVMFNGILESQMERGGSLEDLFARLNRSIHRTRMDSRTYVCFSMGEIDLVRRSLRLANSGCPYAYHFDAKVDEAVELQVDAYPLGVRSNVNYSTIEVQLEANDYIIFNSDGIIEATNAQGEIFGFEQTAETIRQGCAGNLSAEALIDRLIGAVKGFAGDMPQEDDMTVVVLRVEG